MLNIKAAPGDPDRTKALDCATEGEVLGTRFNTVSPKPSFTIWSRVYKIWQQELQTTD
jgi:hypothetical protein